jgi:hypothetical protein
VTASHPAAQLERVPKKTSHVCRATLDAGIQAERASDRMDGEALSTAPDVHLLREYGRLPVEPQQGHHGLSREKLLRATEEIQDQWYLD